MTSTIITATATARADYAYWAGVKWDREEEARANARIVDGNIYTYDNGSTWGICPKSETDDDGREISFTPGPGAFVLQV